jgi:ABC-2 type transport system ATP-binding protein
MRERILTMLVLAAAVAAVLGTGTAAAQSCPNSNTTTVKDSNGNALYTYTRGCILSTTGLNPGTSSNDPGTPIVYNLFEPLNPAPGSLYTILEGPGWGSAGATSPDMNLIHEGYAELTWDPRGFGQSGGVAEVDAPYAEGLDVSNLITQVLTGRPEIATDLCRHDPPGDGNQPHFSADDSGPDTCGEPAVGMTGGSYGGGIQFATAAFDNRVKAIVPVITWNDLNYSLWPNNVIKLGWGELLYGAGLAEQGAEHGQADVNIGALTTGNPFSGGDGGMQIGGYDPMIHYSEVTGATLGYPDNTTKYWFGQRSQAVYGAGPAGHIGDVPTLLEQGTVDTLFNLNDAWANYQEISGRYPDLPVKMIAFCGGHVSCPTGAPPSGINYSDTASKTNAIGPGESAGQFDEQQMLDWFNYYLRGQGKNDGMPAQVVYQDLPTFPTQNDPGPATFVSAPVSGTIVATGATSGASPAAGTDTAVTDGATQDPAEQVTVPVVTAPAKSDLPIVGIGHLDAQVTVSGAATELFFRLIDQNTGDVIDLQTQPLRIDNLDLQGFGTGASLPPSPQNVSLDLAGTAYDLPAGDTLELQVSTATDSFAGNRSPAVVSIAGKVSVPTLSPEG